MSLLFSHPMQMKAQDIRSTVALTNVSQIGPIFSNTIIFIYRCKGETIICCTSIRQYERCSCPTNISNSILCFSCLSVARYYQTQNCS